MLRLILLFSLTSYAITADPSTEDGLDGLVDSVFNDANKPNVAEPCKVGECVPYYQCSNGTIITNGEGLLDSRSRSNIRRKRFATMSHPDTTEERSCKSYLETCCSVQSDVPPNSDVPLLSDVPPNSDVPLLSDVPLIPDVKINQSCGYRNVDGIGFNIDSGKDNEAKYGEFPWTVAILKEETFSGTVHKVYQCGGSLIHPSVVLTAADCVSNKEPSTLKIRAGEWDTQTGDEIFPHQDRQVKEYIIHEQYHNGGLFNNVALLFLEEPVDIAENVNTICLPPQNANFDLQRCFASGWGKDLFGNGGKYQTILKRVELPIVPKDKCLTELRKTRLGPHFELNPSFICAGGELGKDTCKGDGGSPLVCPIPNTENQYYQVGIVSWGIRCGEAIPGIYVNVPLFRNWIEEKLQQKRISTKS